MKKNPWGPLGCPSFLGGPRRSRADVAKPAPDHTLREQVRPLIGRGPGKTSQSEIARRVQMQPGHISAWLAGKRRVSLEKQLTIARAIGLDACVTCS